MNLKRPAMPLKRPALGRGLTALMSQHSAEDAHQLSLSRLRENIKGSSPSEVLMSIRALAGARLNYLQSLRDFDKAQLRLFVFKRLYLALHLLHFLRLRFATFLV